MNRGNLKTLARAYMPLAKKQTVKNPTLDIILQNGAYDVASFSACLKTNQKFDSQVDVIEYDLNDKVNRFLVIDKSGLWYKDGADENYKRLKPRTLKWLDVKVPNWRDMDSGTPMYYYQESNTLGVVPAPDEAITDAFWLYFGAKPEPMTLDTHYPFGLTTEISHLVILQDAILAYWTWQATKILNKGIDAYRLGERAYEAELAKKIALLYRRPDISSSKGNKYGGPKIR